MMADLKDYHEGPLKLLTDSVYYQNKVLIDIGPNRKIIANIMAFDSNFNLVLTNINEKWQEKCCRRNIWVKRERFLAKLFLPGNNLRIIAKL